MYTDPVTIEDNCWIGAGTTICPGVHIGENSVIGAGSVVVHDIPANSVAARNPCKVIREIGEQDQIYYYKDRMIEDRDLEEERKLRQETEVKNRTKKPDNHQHTEYSDHSEKQMEQLERDSIEKGLDEIS